jgi:hypothetical protein
MREHQKKGITKEKNNEIKEWQNKGTMKQGNTKGVEH